MGGESSSPDAFDGGGAEEVLRALATMERRAKQGQKPEDQLIVSPTSIKRPKQREEAEELPVPDMDFLNSKGEAGGIGGGFGWGGEGGASSPWDMGFAALGRGHGMIAGNDPNSPMVPHGRDRVPGDETMIGVGAPVGKAVGSMFGFGGAGELAGQNVGATLADLKAGNIKNLGLDVSQNLPPIPGMQREGWKGLLNGATGLPVASILDLFK